MESDDDDASSLSDVCKIIRTEKNNIPVFRLKTITENFSTSENDYSSESSTTIKKRKRIKQQKNQQQSSKKNPLKCQHCFEIFPNYATHLKHVETMHPVPHACPVSNCYYRTARRWYMRRHTTTVHGSKAIRCSIDGCEGYFVKRVLQKHIKTFHNQKNSIQKSKSSSWTAFLLKTLQKCEICNNFSTQNSNMLETHIKDFHQIGLICPVKNCGSNDQQKIIFGGEIEAHFRENHAEMEFEYSLKNGLKLKNSGQNDSSHEAATDDDIRMDKEEMEEKENSDLDHEFVTIKSAESFDGFQCQNCDKLFSTRRNLIRHNASVHENRYKKFTRAKKLSCSFENCSKSFSCQTLLDDHLNMHNGNYAYKCENCSQSFFARARFAVHLNKYHNKSIKDIILPTTNKNKKNKKEKLFIEELKVAMAASEE